MQLKSIFTDDEAVSPVIGVILMVAITVILAAVIGAFVLNLGGGQNAAPQASFSFNDDGSDTIIKHDGGDPIDYANLEVQTESTSCSVFSGTSNTFETGDSETCTGVTGEDIDLVWSNPDSDDSRIIGEYNA